MSATRMRSYFYNYFPPKIMHMASLYIISCKNFFHIQQSIGILSQMKFTFIKTKWAMQNFFNSDWINFPYFDHVLIYSKKYFNYNIIKINV